MSYSEQSNGRIAIGDAFSGAIERSRYMMFERGDAAKWFLMGFIIFLAQLGKGGGGGGSGGGSNYSQAGRVTQSGVDPSKTINMAKDWLSENLGLILAIGIPVVALILVIGVVVIWLGSRGQAMFVRAVAQDDVSIGENWSLTRDTGHSLFLFRMVLMIAASFIMLTLLVWFAMVVFAVAAAEASGFMPFVMALIPIICVAAIFGITLMLINVLLLQFVVPLMYLRNVSCTEGWRHFFKLASQHTGSIVLFILVRFLYSIVAGIAIVIIGCLTCCLGYLPYLHQVLFSPYYVFDRAFALCALQSLGPEYTFFEKPPAYEAPIPPPQHQL